MKLHIGCGNRYLEGWTHVDIVPHKHVDVVCDIRDLGKSFEKGSISEIYACHVLEHFGRHDIRCVFKELEQLLEPGGVLRIAVPDIEKAIRMYMKGVPLYPTLYGQFWGGQKSEVDYHHVGFDFVTLNEILVSVGFCDVMRYNWKDFLPDGFDDYSRSYLPHMDFEHGELMSLNVVAKKPVNKVVAHCTGGLCNALASLIIGCLLSKKMKVPLWVYWIEGYTALDCAVTDLFERGEGDVRLMNAAEFEQVMKELGACRRFCGELPELSLSDSYKREPVRHDIRVFGSVDECVRFCQDADVFVCTPEIPGWMVDGDGDGRLHETFDAFFERFKIKDVYMKRVHEFIHEHGIGRVGVHIRGTDILSVTRCGVHDVHDFIKNVKLGCPPDTKIFLCSDDELIETAYRDDDRIVFYRDKKYVCKRDENLGWYHDAGLDHLNCASIEYDGKTYKNYSSCNVIRTNEQIRGAWIDLLTLASMEQIVGFVTSNMSTYFKMANLLHRAFKTNETDR